MRRLLSVLLPILALMSVRCTRHDADPITDTRDILSTRAESRIMAFQQSLLQNQDIELSIDVPQASPDDLERYAHDRMEQLRIGQATGTARGVLLIVDVDAAAVRMEIGIDLEHVFPDAFVGFVEYDQMAPFFADNRVGDGIEATVELLVARAQDAIAHGDFDPNRDKDRTDLAAGGGAGIQAPIGGGNKSVRDYSGYDLGSAQPSPSDVLSAYLEILDRNNTAPDHELYTPETRTLLGNRTVTRAQQLSEYRQLAPLIEQVTYVQQDSLAVALFQDMPTVPPYFIRRGGRGWMLDLAASSRIIGFDLQNRWHYRGDTLEYGFAFRDPSPIDN